MDYREAVTAAAGALQRGDDARWELARLTYENTTAGGGTATLEEWAEDVREKSGRRFRLGTAGQYSRMWQRNSRNLERPDWTEAYYEMVPKDSHENVAARGAKYTAEKGDAQAAAEAVKIALDRPEVADLVVADDQSNMAVTHARVRHHDEALAVGEVKDPERRDARHATGQREVMYELVKFRNWLFRTTESAREWNWTPDLREEFTDTLDGVQGALDAFKAVPNFDQELADLLQGDNQ